MEQKLEQTKHKGLPYKETVNMQGILGRKVLAKDGKRLGKIKSIHIGPKSLTIEGIHVDTGMFNVDHYFGKNYIQVLNEDGAVLKINPVNELIGLTVYDSDGKEIGKVSAINRSKMTNRLLSIVVVNKEAKEGFSITADYIETIGENIMLKEPFDKGFFAQMEN
jgi:sporulation protein YlmC with PRC-barrel domain